MQMEARSSIPVVILAGGRGSRLGENTDKIPKPMVKVQGVPIIDRIIHNFKTDGFQNFIISAGYKHEVLEDYYSKTVGAEGITVVDTGIETQTAGRILSVKEYIKSPVFMACYGDAITAYRPKELLEVHSKNNPVCMMMIVHPLGRFGDVQFNSRGVVTKFSEKPMGDKWINGGYFAFSSRVFDYMTSPRQILETDIFSMLVKDRELYCDSFEGFWHSLDTQKDLAELNEMELP